MFKAIRRKMESWPDFLLSDVSYWVGVAIIWLAFFSTLAGIAAFLTSNEKDRRSRIESDQAQERFLAIEKENLQLKKDISDNDKATAEANERASKAEENTKRLEVELQKEVNKNRPRSLSAEDKATLFTSLKDAPKGLVAMSANIGDTEGRQYSIEIGLTLEEAGYNVQWFVREGGFQMIYEGVFGYFRSSDRMPPHMFPIVEAFRKIDVWIVIAENDLVTSDSMFVFGVSGKPYEPIKPGNPPRNMRTTIGDPTQYKDSIRKLGKPSKFGGIGP